MKNLIFAALSFCLLFSFCKKKESTPEATPTPETPASQITLKINGSDFTYNTTSSLFMNPTRMVNFVNNTTNEQISIAFYSKPLAGNYVLAKYGSPSIKYTKNNINYYSVSGNFNVTQIDTNASHMITKLIGTFSCLTDTSSSTSFSITSGSINYQQ